MPLVTSDFNSSVSRPQDPNITFYILSDGPTPVYFAIMFQLQIQATHRSIQTLLDLNRSFRVIGYRQHQILRCINLFSGSTSASTDYTFCLPGTASDFTASSIVLTFSEAVSRFIFYSLIIFRNNSRFNFFIHFYHWYVLFFVLLLQQLIL